MSKKRLGVSALLDGNTLDLDKERDISTTSSPVINAAERGRIAIKTMQKLERLADPKRCKIWAAHDRDSIWFNEENCADLIASFQTSLGQQKPAIARLISGDPNFDFEIIEGARRRWTAEFLKRDLALELRDITDAEAAAMMESENADRQDISAFERACSYQRLIEMNVFTGTREISRALNVDKSVMSVSLGAAKLKHQKTLMSLFDDIREIPVKPAYKLMTAMNKEEQLKGAVLACAQTISQMDKKPAASKIIKLLLESMTDTAPKVINKNYSDVNGKVWVKAETKKGELVLKITPQGEGINKRDHKKLVSQALAELL